jgi:phosphatidylserine/phosphatidylglycerophosphate/cardiolipin synthase-like enzyme
MKTENINFRLRVDGKWQWKVVTACILSILLIIVATSSIDSIRTANQTHVYYSLDTRHNDQELIKVIDNAGRYVYFAIYYFTKNSIADALIRAKKRGVDVIGIMDRDSSLNSNAKVLERLDLANIRVLTQRHPDGIMHMKALVTEKAYASGSYNWTDGATNVNDEVLEVGTNESVRKQYLEVIKHVLLINN